MLLPSRCSVAGDEALPQQFVVGYTVPIFLRGTEANSKMVPISRVPIPRNRTVAAAPVSCEAKKVRVVCCRHVLGLILARVYSQQSPRGGRAWSCVFAIPWWSCLVYP